MTTDILKDYYHQDRLGSTTNLTDKFGRVVGRADYNEWGEITYREALTITSSYRRIYPQSNYTGHDWDDVLGMYYAKARFYSAEDKRFVAMDPVKGSIAQPLSLVPYVYCVDNPLRWVDPMGLRLECLDVFGGGKAVSPKNGKNQTAKDQMETAQRANIVLPTQDISAGIGQDVHQSDVKMMVAMPVPIMPVVPFHSIGPKFNSPSISPWQGAGIVPQRENGWYYIAKGIIQPIQDAVNKFWDWAFSKKYEVKRTPSDFASRFGCPEADEAAEESETPDDTQTPVDVAGTPGGPKKDDDDDHNHMVGENGTKTNGSVTTGRNGPTERVDVENMAPGTRPGNLHYHEPNNTKWIYDIATKKLVDPKTGTLAPPKIQKVLQKSWVIKAINKAFKDTGRTQMNWIANRKMKVLLNSIPSNPMEERLVSSTDNLGRLFKPPFQKVQDCILISEENLEVAEESFNILLKKYYGDKTGYEAANTETRINDYFEEPLTLHSGFQIALLVIELWAMQLKQLDRTSKFYFILSCNEERTEIRFHKAREGEPPLLTDDIENDDGDAIGFTCL